MSFGLVEGESIKTKKALREAVNERGADNVMVFDTSAFSNRGTIPVSALKPADVIVGPDVYERRTWFANAKPDRTGKIVIV